MTRPNTPARAALIDLIERLGQPDLSTEQGRLDYRALLLSENALAILDLPELDADAAVDLYHAVVTRLRCLLDLKLIDEPQGKDLIGELVALYARFRPELIPRILKKPEAAPDA